MEVEDQLSSAALAVGYQTEPLFLQAHLLGDLNRCPVKPANDRVIFRLQRKEGANVLFWDDKYMYRRYRVYIFEGDNRLVFINHGRWDFLLHNPAKQAIFHKLHPRL